MNAHFQQLYTIPSYTETPNSYLSVNIYNKTKFLRAINIACLETDLICLETDLKKSVSRQIGFQTNGAFIQDISPNRSTIHFML